jgi:hypothetical protein
LALSFPQADDAGLPLVAFQQSAAGGKQIERWVISTFQIAESLGFKGMFRQWEHLLRVGE